MPRCPGQDQRYWTADDIFDVCCPYCDQEIEFWKDEPFRLCRTCMKEVRNPRIDLGCAKWCKFSDQCLGSSADEQLAAAPVIAKLKAQLKGLTESDPARYEAAMEIYRIANLLVTSEGGDPCHVKTGALLIGVIRETPAPLELAHSLLADTILDEEETTVIIDALAFRGHYSKLFNVSELDLTSYGADAVLSKGFAMFTPYIGIGAVVMDSEYTGSLPANQTLQKFSDTSPRYFGGLLMTITLFQLTADIEYLEEPVYSLKVGIGW